MTRILTLKIYTKLQKNLKAAEIDEKLQDILDIDLLKQIYQFGYIPVQTPSKKFIMTDRGPIVSMLSVEHNSGLYILRNEDGAYMLEVVIPNTIDKSNLITEVMQEMDNLLTTVDTTNLEVYDLTIIYAHLITNQIIKPLARAVFPENELHQSKFVDIYLPRFLANTARYYIGDSKLTEEAVNAEPHIVKLMVEGSDELKEISKKIQKGGGKSNE